MPRIQVFSLGGECLGTVVLEPGDVLGVLARRAALALGVLHCALVSAGGISLRHTTTYERSGLCDGDAVTAIARGRAPLLVGGRHLSAFAAVRAGGSVVTWGVAARGGDSAAVRKHLSSQVLQVVGNVHVLAAVKADGSVITWGVPHF